MEPMFISTLNKSYEYFLKINMKKLCNIGTLDITVSI